MSLPRCVRPGRTWLITRNVTRRQHGLRPDADGTAQQIYRYTTAVYAKKYGIKLHASQVLSTHMHEVLTDVYGNLPAFLRERNRALANAMKAHRNWPDEFFERAPASCVELYGPEAILKEIGYTLANCVEAGLASDPSEWPGVTTLASDLGGRVIEVERPRLYFDAKNPVWPAVATLAIEMPESLTKTFGDAAFAVVSRAVATAVARARASIAKAGRRFARVRDLLHIPVTRAAASPRPRKTRQPTFAAAGNLAQLRLAFTERRAFYAAYRNALDALGLGLLGVPFPEGTWRWCRELIPPLRLRPILGAA